MQMVVFVCVVATSKAHWFADLPTQRRHAQYPSTHYGPAAQVDERGPQIPTALASRSVRWHSPYQGPGSRCGLFLAHNFQCLSAISQPSDLINRHGLGKGQRCKVWRLKNTYNGRDLRRESKSVIRSASVVVGMGCAGGERAYEIGTGVAPFSFPRSDLDFVPDFPRLLKKFSSRSWSPFKN
jgi:hypothetical protein